MTLIEKENMFYRLFKHLLDWKSLLLDHTCILQIADYVILISLCVKLMRIVSTFISFIHEVVVWFSWSLHHEAVNGHGLVDFPGGSDGKQSACNTGEWGPIPGQEDSLSA